MKLILALASLALAACTADTHPRITAKIAGQLDRTVITEAVIEDISGRTQTYEIYCTAQGLDGRYQILAETVTVSARDSVKIIGMGETEGETLTDIRCLAVKPKG